MAVWIIFKCCIFWGVLGLNPNTLDVCNSATGSFRYDDHWIGLMRGVNLTCSCDDLGGDCVECRETWLWKDDSAMRYRYEGWRKDYYPDPGPEACGRLNQLGWGDLSCNYTLYYICEMNTGKSCRLSAILRNKASILATGGRLKLTFASC